MTSREATGLLPRALHGFRPSRSLRDWASLLTFAPITAPFLLKSLYGGTEDQRHALLDRIGLPHDALPHLGSWKADVGLLNLLVDHILAEKPQVVVEFGAGASTLVIAKAMQMAGGGTHIAFDQHGDFVEATGRWLADHGLEADLRAVPLVPAPGGWPGLWYDHEPLPDAIDLLVVDGPPWTIHPLTRGAAGTLLGRLNPGGAVILDDAARPGERVIARRWRRMWPDFDFRFDGRGSKGALIGRRVA
ncbi:class I SAM-dependent methyltransferase [Allosphingosinicella indica]|uniref:Methyltransferase domain-containing protein n=1 Tax=Allosphingosinicella indica TaxID=941907 RepID=A0A1X7GEQ0_9SPHN|nr:class I SAM-dependent methyltransferase [Allosphingosinicella indica]SMF68687.1 Methyltransferase domain-containing protein [Allosphingosinicella indica]